MANIFDGDRELFLLRHAFAAQHRVDALRPLSQKGQALASYVGQEMLDLKMLEHDFLICSPTVRSVETAECLLGGPIRPVIVPELLLGPAEMHLAALLRLYEDREGKNWDASFNTWQESEHFDALLRLGNDFTHYLKRQFEWGWWPELTVGVGHMPIVAYMANRWCPGLWDDEEVTPCSGIQVIWLSGNNDFFAPDEVKKVAPPSSMLT